MLKVAHCKQTKICAFCQRWYDPCNSSIQPHNGQFYKYENSARNRCTEKNIDTAAWNSCSSFRCKF